MMPKLGLFPVSNGSEIYSEGVGLMVLKEDGYIVSRKEFDTFLENLGISKSSEEDVEREGKNDA